MPEHATGTSEINVKHSPSSSEVVLDGFAIAVTLAALFCAMRLGVAGNTVESLGDSADVPRWMALAWGIVTVVGVVSAAFVAHRLIKIARLHASGSHRRRLDSHLLVCIPYLAIVLWLGLQALEIWELQGGPDIWDPVGPVGLGLVLAAGVLTAAYTTGSVLGDATAAWESATVLRLHLIALGLLFVLVFTFPFTSDQLADVLLAWGDERDDRLAQPLTGIAAALLLGAAFRASATRLLVPHDAGADDPTGRKVLRFIVGGFLVAAALAALVLRLEALAFLLAAVGMVLVLTTPAAPVVAVEPNRCGVPDGDLGAESSKPDRAVQDRRESLRRLAGTLGAVPMAIVLVGVVRALTDALLLADARPSALLGATIFVVVLFALVSAYAHHASDLPPADFENTGEESWVAGFLGFAAGLCFVASATVAAILLLAFAIVFAFQFNVTAADNGRRQYRLGGPGAESGRRELWAAAGVALGVGLAVYLEPLEVSRGAGAFGLAFIGLAGIVVLLHAAASAGMRRKPVGKLGKRLSRPPVVVLVAAWIAVALLTAHETAHQAQTVETGTGTHPRVSLPEAVNAWLDREADPKETTGDKPVPMLFVAASGGGAKAAYWTDLVLDCMFGNNSIEQTGDECKSSVGAADRRRRLFLTSSVSGGSVGIYHYVTKGTAGEKRWVNENAGREILSPVVAWGLFHDLPALLTGAKTNPQRCVKPLNCPVHADRALVQEAAIEAGSRSRALLDYLSPLMIFNGSSTLLSQTVVLSRAKLAAPAWDSACPGDGSRPLPAAADGHDVLEKRDVRLVTAAMLTARFPLLEPPGRLGVTNPPVGEPHCPPLDPIVIRDGGLRENTGLLTIVNLLPMVNLAIERWRARRGHGHVHVSPIVVSIDDDLDRIGRAKGLRRLWLGAFGASGNRSSRARESLMGGGLGVSCFMRISPSPHIGARAATGWELSDTSRRLDLVASLRDHGRGAAGARVESLRRLLDGTSSGCSKPADSGASPFRAARAKADPTKRGPTSRR